MAHICRGKNIVQLGPSFITNLLQTGASLKEASWFWLGNVFPLWAKRNHCLFSPCIFFHGRHGMTRYPCWNLYLFRVRLAFLYTNWVSQAFNVHNSNLNYKYMLQYTKMARKIIHVSLGACLSLVPGMGMNYNRTGVLARPQTFGISIFKSP